MVIVTKQNVAETTTRCKEKLRGKALVPSRAQAYPAAEAGGPQLLGQHCPSPWELQPQRLLSASLPRQALASELQAQKPLLGEVERNLQGAKRCSSALASRFQEHCPDLERQEAEVHKLGQRSDNLRQQLELR